MNFKLRKSAWHSKRVLITGLLMAGLGLLPLPAGAANKVGGQTAPAALNSLNSLSTLPAGTMNREGGLTAPPGRKPFPKPQSHSGNWLEYHGRSADVNVAVTGNACLVCHEKTDCISCHQVRLPRDHTNTWRTLSHGFTAEGNRERCLTCHKQDFCVRCHNETAPRSHTGNWTRRHCTWCHYGSGLAPADNCVVCHKQAPHTSAPHNITPALNCALCHR